MELHLSSTTILFLTFGIAFLAAAMLAHFINWLNDYMHPDDPYEFLKKYLGKQVEYNHKQYKIMIKGKIAGISVGKGNAPKGKPNYIVMIVDGEYKHPVSLYDEGKTWNIVN